MNKIKKKFIDNCKKLQSPFLHPIVLEEFEKSIEKKLLSPKYFQGMKFPSISLVIPCYNEANRVKLLFQGVEDFKNDWQGEFEVIIVDDGSTDNTAKIVQDHTCFTELLAQGKTQLIQQENQGKGAALRTGIMVAKYAFTLTLDADMAAAPSELIEWLKIGPFEASQIWIGSRELNAHHVKDHWHRKFIGNVFNLLIRLIAGLKIRDTQCGFKLYPTVIGQQLFRELLTNGWAHDVEILKRAKKKGIPVIEMPLHWNAVDGSKINLVQDSIRMFFEVCRIAQMRMS